MTKFYPLSLLSSVFVLLCLACGKGPSIVGDWALDLSLSKISELSKNNAPSDAPFKLKLNKDGTFEMYPFFLEGNWNLDSDILNLKPSTTSAPLEVIVTGKSVGKTPSFTMNLDNKGNLVWSPNKGNPNSSVKFVFTKKP